jgi:hypothetical protein
MLVAESADQSRFQTANGDGAIFGLRETEAGVLCVQVLIPSDLLSTGAIKSERGKGRIPQERRQFARLGQS